jgi:O-antigen/teichoic acid export membrane protein
MRSQLPHNVITLLISNVGSAVLSFILSVLIGRALGEEGLGVYAAALAWVFPLSLAAEFGLGSLITRDLAQHPEREDYYLRATTRIRLVIGGGLLALVVISAPLLSHDVVVARGLQISAPLIVILPLFGLFTAVFRARQAMWPIPWLNIGMLMVQVVLTAMILVTGGDVVAALVVNVATSAAQMAAAWAVWYWKFKPSASVDSPFVTDASDLMRRALPFAVAAILAALQSRVSLIMLERMSSTAEVGYFAAASRFVEAGRMIPNALFGALFPALAVMAARPLEFHRMFARSMWGLAILGLVFGLGVSLFASGIVQLTFGANFVAAVPALQVLMWSLLPGLLRAGRTLYWYALGHERFANIVTGISLVIQVTFSLWLIPLYGAMGAAAAGIASEVIALALLWRPMRLFAQPYAER